MDLETFIEAEKLKRMKEETDKLHEKISGEKTELLKLRVSQDALYWEMKEKLSSTQRQHETLQRNMVQLQMEHETLSAQYQDELRRRPETLNKLESTRKLCDVLEENVSRVREMLQRSAADRAKLADAYARAGVAVAAATADAEKRLSAATEEARAARDLARLSSEHCAQLAECVSRESARADQAAADGARLRDQQDVLAGQLARRDTLLQQNEKTIQELRNELRQVVAEFNERNERARNVIAELEQEAGAAPALRTALAQAEARAESASGDVARLSADLAALQAAKDDATQQVAALNLKLQEAQSHIDKMNEALNFLVEKGEDVAKQLKDKEEIIKSLEKDMAASRQEVLTLTERVAINNEERNRERRSYEERQAEWEREHRDYEERIVAAQRELIELTNTIEKLTCDIEEMKKANARAEATISEQAAQLERDRDENEKRATAADCKLAEYADKIIRLKHDIAVEAEARARSDTALAELTATRERENHDNEERAVNDKRELNDRNDTIACLQRELAVETEAHARADASLAEIIAELERERHDFEKRAADNERELSERNDAIARLQRDLTVESEARARADSALASSRAELNTAREDAARALEDVRHLKADSRRKDDEAAKQMQIILKIRDEKEQMQQKMRTMQETINNIQEITSKAPPPGAGAGGAARRHDPPEHDDNAVAAPPTPFQQFSKPSQASIASDRARAPSATPPGALQRTTEAMYELFSDSDSMNGDKLDPNEVRLRFEALQRGAGAPLAAPRARRELKRGLGPASRKRAGPASPMAAPRSVPARAQPAPAPAPRPADNVRKFFKTRRLERD